MTDGAGPTSVTDGQDGDGGQDGGDERGRGPGRDVVEVGGQQLDRDGGQDDRQSGPQVAEPGRCPGQQEVQRPHAQQGEHVGRVDDERVGGDGQDGRDGVDGEDQVGDLDHDQRHQQRRGQQSAAVTDDKPLAAQVLGGGQEPA